MNNTAEKNSQVYRMGIDIGSTTIKTAVIDENGKVTMNFGPLNADGGWRRLNVAITRSRKQMMIFSVFLDSKCDIKQTQRER